MLEQMAQAVGMETYVGIIRTPADAITLFEACRLGLLPRVYRRLSEKERQQIKSGSVFVWDEREAGMRRWTDGKSWSASRVSGSFLTYREMEGKRSGGNGTFSVPTRSGRTPEGSRTSDDGEQNNTDESPDGYRYKPDGLMKQSFSITTSTGQHLHLISYFSRHATAQAHLKQPTTDPTLRHIKPAPGMYPESSVQDTHTMPPVTTRPPTVPAGPPQQAPTMAGYATKYLRGGQQQPSPAPIGPAGPMGYQQQSQPPPGYPAGPPQVALNGYGPPHYPSQASPHVPHAHPYYPSAPPAHHSPLHSQGPPSSYQSTPGSLPSLSRNTTPPSDSSRSLHHRSGSGGSFVQSYYPSPRSTYMALTPHSSHPSQATSPASTPPGAQLDPRMVAPSPLSQASPHNLHPEYAPASSRRSASPQRPPPTTYPPTNAYPNQPFSQGLPPTSVPAGAPLASTIPSIGALMNGADEYERTRSRSTSKSPGSAFRRVEGGDASSTGGPRDIPHDKISFGEDRRALSVLNKAFRT